MKTLKLAILFLILGFSCFSQSETEKITATALDYIEGWYSGDTLRMERALHPDLVKSKPVVIELTKRTVISTLSKSYMVESTRIGLGKKTPQEKIKNEVKVLDVSGTIAVVKVTSYDYIDYLQLVKANGQWQ